MVASEPVDFLKLEAALRAVAFANRLELLQILRTPRTLAEIRLTAKLVRPGHNPDRAISRQAIEGHLARLRDVGLVVEKEGRDPEGRRARQYVVNERRLYLLMEEFRKVGTQAKSEATSPEMTVGLGGAAPVRVEPGPKLLLVHGLREGQAFPLRRTDLREGRGWVVGRKAGLHVSLPYDPYVSVENSEVVVDPKGYHLMDLRSSRNGTWVNWRRLEKGEKAPLRPGDVVGVGRSFLVFQPE